MRRTTAAIIVTLALGILVMPLAPDASFLNQTEIAARALGVELQLLEARSLNDFDSAFAAMTTKRAGALLVLGDVMFVTHRIRLAELVAKSRLPAMYTLREYVEAGGLMSYGPIAPSCSGAPPPTSIRSSRAPSRRTCPWSSPRSSN